MAKKANFFKWISRIWMDIWKRQKRIIPWNAYIYENKDQLKNAIKENKINNQIILIGNNNIDEYLIKNNYVEIGIIAEQKYSQNKDELNRYLNNIKYDKENMRKTINNIYTYLRERFCYFNQLGNNSPYYPRLDFSINILLTGISKMGKSTFVNLLSRKQVALSNGSHKSVTKKETKYKIYKTIEDRKIGIIFYDTPGLTDDKNKENINIIEFIKK